MPSLEVFLKNVQVERAALNGERFTVGRKSDCSLVLHDLTVSRAHAELVYDATGRYWVIANASETNPIKLNGEVVTRPEILFDGDHVSVGAYTLLFREDAAKAGEGPASADSTLDPQSAG